ncbi:MAG: Hpt domain-containing protein [Bacteroidota bacterium]|nr:Hpt domain-containing protein [Bacteroidota bacterium]
MSIERLYNLKPLLEVTGSEDDAEMQKEFMELFISTSKEYMQEIVSAFEKRELADLQAAAHALKSSLRQFRVDSLDDTIVEIENIGKSRQYSDKLPEIISFFKEELNLVLVQIQQDYDAV